MIGRCFGTAQRVQSLLLRFARVELFDRRVGPFEPAGRFFVLSPGVAQVFTNEIERLGETVETHLRVADPLHDHTPAWSASSNP